MLDLFRPTASAIVYGAVFRSKAISRTRRFSSVVILGGRSAADFFSILLFSTFKIGMLVADLVAKEFEAKRSKAP